MFCSVIVFAYRKVLWRQIRKNCILSSINGSFFEHFLSPFYNEEYCLMKYENATVCYDDESLKKQADQKYLEFIIQLEKLGVEIIENNVTIESGPKDYRMNVQFLLEANASEKCALESQVQELQKQE